MSVLLGPFAFHAPHKFLLFFMIRRRLYRGVEDLFLVEVFPGPIEDILIVLFTGEGLERLKAFVFGFVAHVADVSELFEFFLYVGFVHFGQHFFLQVLDLLDFL